ncbi:cell division protein ZapA [uncultured Thiohalocapsa sp.]|uniref:cell division protein ZapA n=1 Tax=uncultured Thiohalocapsa sp. TaxID=768990 RepID=UPI0025F79CC9|nr:cell division protein ZapA [uncultured Thiohalocapsa sp.]
MSDESIPVTVQILDKDYRIACAPGEEQGLMESARLLDKRMREVRQNGRVIGADRIAVMAGLNLIYELMQRNAKAALDIERLARLQSRIDEAAGTGGATAGVDAPGDSV